MTPYKRSKAPGAPYYVQITVAGKRRQVCTGKVDYQNAVTEGMRLAAEARMGMKLLPTLPPEKITLQTVVDLYLENAVNARPITKTQNVCSLKRFLCFVGLTLEDNPSALTKQLVIKFQAAWIRAHPGKATSSNSILRQARSIFCRHCEPIYEHLGKLEIDGWMRYPLLKETRKSYTPPSKDVLDKLFEAVVVLKQKDKGCYAAFTLACYTGMRAGEIASAKWDWVQYDQATGAPYIRVPGEFAKSNADRLLPISRDVLNELKAIRGRGDFLVPAPTDNARKMTVCRRHSRWLAAHGMKRNGKTNHELRKLFGATVATKQGLYAAQKLLGHSSPKLTSDVYAALIDLPAPLPLRSVDVVSCLSVPQADTAQAAG